MDRPMKILFLPRWYPDRHDPMPGLFIRQLAESLTPFFKIAVLYPVEDRQMPGSIEIDRRSENGVDVIRVCYRPFNCSIPFLRTMLNAFLFLRSFFKGLRELNEFTPDLIHAHILTRHAVLAWYCSQRFGVPFIVSEHWSRYFPGSGYRFNLVHLWFTRLMVRCSSALVPVSDSLRKAMDDLKIRHSQTFVLGNPVDTSRFVPGKTHVTTPGFARLLHVSCFDDRSKNISGLLRVISKISRIRNDFQLVLVGEGPDFSRIKEYAESIGLDKNFVMFAGLITEEQMVNVYQTASFLVQSSRYETFGTVIPEAMSCGKPVVSSATGVAAWLVSPDSGILFSPEDENSMELSIIRMIDHYMDYNPEQIRQRVLDCCSREKTVEGIIRVYRTILE